jgi:hypothetical protein
VRHLLGIHVLHDRRIGGGTHRTDDGENLIIFDQLARLLDRLGRLVAVVE